MNEDEIKKNLASEGFKEISTPEFKPNFKTSIHTHDTETVHIILSGELTLVEGDKKDFLKTGDKYIIKAGTTHYAEAGPNGCKFIVGFRE